MTSSILLSIKKLLGIDEECTDFDDDIIIHINSVFAILTQLGVGPSEGFYIENDSADWDDFIPESPTLNDVRTYVGLKVQLIFDPSASSVITEVKKELIRELEWRLNVAAETE